MKKVNGILFYLWIGMICISLPAWAGAESFPLIRSWADVEKNIPAGQRIVTVAGPEWFILYQRADIIADSTSLTGECAVQPKGLDDWYINWPMVWAPTGIDPNKEHTLYALIKVKKTGDEGVAFGYGFSPENKEAKELRGPIPAAALRNNTWQLIKLARKKAPGDLFFNAKLNKMVPYVFVAAFILTSDYDSQPRIKEYLSPNGDGLNDQADISFAAPLGKAVKVDIYDSRGETVKGLMDTKAQAPLVSAVWDGTDAKGKVCAPGKYSVRIAVDGRVREYPQTIILEQIKPWKPVTVKDPDFFPIGVCVEGEEGVMFPAFKKDAKGIAAFYEKIFSDLHSNGFNSICLFRSTSQYAPMILKTAEKYHMRVILATNEMCGMGYATRLIPESEIYRRMKAVTDRFSNYPGLLRYMIIDEPSPNHVDTWVTMRRIGDTLDPEHPIFSVINTISVLKTITRKTVVSEAVPDIYPIRPGGDMTFLLNSYAVNVDNVVRMAKGRPVWAMPQTFGGYGSFKIPNETEVRSMTWLSLAKGAKGYIYFLYNDVPPMLGLMDQQQKPRPMYREAGRLAKVIGKLSPILLNLTPAELGIKLADLDRYELGQFQNKKGERYMIVVSKDVEKAGSARLRFTLPDRVKKVIDLVTGGEIAVDDTGLRCELAPGEGRIFKLIY